VSHVMNRALPLAGVVIGCLSVVHVQSHAATQAPPAGPPRINVCSLLPKEEVKKHLPWIAALDQMPIEEEAIGANGSSCNFPTVHVQVLPFSQGMIDAARKAGAQESISGIGDEAYFRNNKNRFAEIFVKVGQRVLTLQADADDGIEKVKPGVLNLAKVYVTKLR
jgi:hypothetical protein